MVLKLIALVVPLGLDSFAVAAALGMAGVSEPRERARVSILFGVFEAAMPLIGFAAGAPLGHAIGATGDYVAIGVLAVLGIVMLRADDEEERVSELARLRGSGAVLLGLSISLDELAIGLTLGLLRVPVLPVAIAVGVQAVVLSQLGLRLGARVGERVREGAERVAGLTLLALAGGLLIARLLG
jgi:putative Mn2+ efflux pump MntP